MNLTRTALTGYLLLAAASVYGQANPSVVEKVTLNTGLRAVVRTEPTSRTVAICVFVGAGVAEDSNQPGVGAVAARSLFGSNLNQSREEVLRSIYDVGGSLETEWNPDYTLYTCVTSAERFEDALYVICQALKGAQFDAESVSLAKTEVLADIAHNEQDAYTSAYAALRQRMYRESPYRETWGGTTGSVKRLTTDQIRSFYRRYYTPENTVFAIAGNVTVPRARRTLDNYLDDYTRNGTAQRSLRGPEVLAESGLISRFQPSSTATLLAGFSGPGIAHPDYPAWLLLSAVIGGGKSSRVWRGVRDTAGIGYVVRAQAAPLLRDSPMIVHLEYDSSRAGVGGQKLEPRLAGDLLLKTSKSVLDQLVGERELDRAKTYTIGTYALAHQRARDRAFYLGWYELLGLGHEMDSQFPSRIAAVTLEQVQQAANKYLRNQILVTLLPSQR